MGFSQTPTAVLDSKEATEAAPNGAEIDFVSETVDYGDIEYGADGHREFTFTNTGNEPLIITNCKGSCGCTVPKCPKEPVMPGETSVIKVKYDTKRPGPFTKSITVSSNASAASKVIKIKGKVGAKPLEETTPVKKNVSPIMVNPNQK